MGAGRVSGLAARLRAARAEAGLVYNDGDIEVHAGDCREVVPRRLRALGLRPEDVALVHADPPFDPRQRFDGARRGRGGRLVGGRGRPRANDWPPMAGNDRPFDPSHLLHFPRIVLWGANHYASRLPDQRGWLFWDKRAETGSNDGGDGELAWTNLRTPIRRFTHLWRGVARASETGVAHLGPTQKPVALVEWVFRERAKLRRGDVVVVPYLGTGPELTVCRAMGLRCIAVDIVPHWCRVAVEARLLTPPARSAIRPRVSSAA